MTDRHHVNAVHHGAPPDARLPSVEPRLDALLPEGGPSALISTERRVFSPAASNDIGLSGAVEWRMVMAP